MQALIDFFALRPVFTLCGLRIIWYAYLLNLVIQFFTLTAGIYAAHVRGNFWLWPNLVSHLLTLLITAALVRVLLEIAAAILLRRGPIKTT